MQRKNLTGRGKRGRTQCGKKEGGNQRSSTPDVARRGKREEGAKLRM